MTNRCRGIKGHREATEFRNCEARAKGPKKTVCCSHIPTIPMFRLAITAALSALALGQDFTADNGFLDANVGIGADSKLSGSSPPPPSPPPTASTHTDSCHAEVRKKSENEWTNPATSPARVCRWRGHRLGHQLAMLGSRVALGACCGIIRN